MIGLNKFVEYIERYVCIICFSIMLLLTFVNVFSRFVAHMSLSFSEEIVTSLFVLASLAGTSAAIRDGSHLGLDYFTSFMPKKVQRFLIVLGNVLGIIMCAIIFYLGILMVEAEYSAKQLSATMQWPEWIYGTCVPLGAALLIFRYSFAIYLIARGKSGVVTQDLEVL